jgi:UDPglucose 6-dehydrogenase
VVSNPEFLAEGAAVKNYLHPDRIIVGVNSPRAQKMMKELYASYHDRLLVMDIPSAELCKYAANGMLALRISYMNDIACLCEKLGANIDAVRMAMGADPRIGKSYLNPGIGYGGSCLPKDVRALRSTAKQCQHPSSLFDSILEINSRQRELFLSKINDYFGDLSDKTFAIWGLSFKPNTDDLREAPALYLIESLLELGTTVKVYDPVAMPKAKHHFQNGVHFCESEYEAAEETHGIILVTEWEQFKQVDFAKIAPKMAHKAFFDGRNQYIPTDLQKFGFDYFCIGKKMSRSLASIQS